jgi:16S rRNA (cytosine967-C5)-methyltransferase
VSPSSDARSVALAAILRVAEHAGYSNLVIPAALARSGLATSERNLAAELAYGTIRRLVRLDWVLASKLERPIARTPPRALALLRLGAYQLLFTRIPAHAAVAETVRLATTRERAFVNAVLRRIAERPVEWPAGSSDADVSVRTGLAAWAVAELRREVGADAEDAARALAERAPLTLRTNTRATTIESLERALREAGRDPDRGRVHSGSLLLPGGAPGELPGFDQGWFAIQDQASSFVVDALGPEPGELVLDACAAPGGKAGHIASLVSPGGVAVAADRSADRVCLVRRQADRLGVRALLVAQDARRPALRGPFDRILVDAPCSGLGSARRRPELLWRVRREELAGLGSLQAAIVASVARLLRPGGRLVYSVCTFSRAETDAVCDRILRRCPDLAPDRIDGPDGSAARVRLWPHRHGTDAMFVAAFRRRATAPD